MARENIHIVMCFLSQIAHPTEQKKKNPSLGKNVMVVVMVMVIVIVMVMVVVMVIFSSRR